MVFRRTIANEQNACYWFVAHIIYDKELLEQVQKEIEPAWQSGKLDIKFLTSQCPTVDAIFYETLRQRTNTFGWRIVKEKMTIHGKELRPGIPVMVPLRLLHGNGKVWGSSVDVFNPRRFLEKKSLARQPSYRPFASGRTHCPGRVLAKQETYAFVATLLHRFHVEIIPAPGASPTEKPPFPIMESARPPTGVKGPVVSTDFRVGLELKARS